MKTGQSVPNRTFARFGVGVAKSTLSQINQRGQKKRNELRIYTHKK